MGIITLPNGTVADISPWSYGNGTTTFQTGPAWPVNLPSNWNLTGVSANQIGMNIYSSTPLTNNGGWTLLGVSHGVATIQSNFPAAITWAPSASDATSSLISGPGQYYVKFFATINSLLYMTDYVSWEVQA